jgi:membrane-bound lytic murein transglycosylase B
MQFIKYLFFSFFCLFSNITVSDSLDQEAVNTFIDYMESTHQYDRTLLEVLFTKAKKSDSVLNAISKPAEALPWYEYRTIFVQTDRIEQGLLFWKEHKELLSRAESDYGVPAEIIVAIIGVETRYGKQKGNNRVLDALSTLAFHYPKRGDFFRGELEQFLLLTREQNIDPLNLRGSYAGAMGIPQFIPSSFRNYAVDFDTDGKTDIWTNTADAIGSIANYFKVHGWKNGESIVVSGTATGNKYTEVLNNDLKPEIQSHKLSYYEIEVSDNLPVNSLVKVMSLAGNNGEEIWLGLNNFYVITRYNRSPLYAMAVYQLSDAIKKKYFENQ